MQEKRTFDTRTIAVIGVLAAMVFALTYVGIDIPSPLGKCKIHFGNIMCILSGLLFGPVTGGLAAGIGSALFDLTDPSWAPEFWITFINKFAMGCLDQRPVRLSDLQLPVHQQEHSLRPFHQRLHLADGHLGDRYRQAAGDPGQRCAGRGVRLAAVPGPPPGAAPGPCTDRHGIKVHQNTKTRYRGKTFCNGSILSV